MASCSVGWPSRSVQCKTDEGQHGAIQQEEHKQVQAAAASEWAAKASYATYCAYGIAKLRRQLECKAQAVSQILKQMLDSRETDLDTLRFELETSNTVISELKAEKW